MKLSRVVVAALLSMSLNASADVWYVDKDNSGAEDGTSWGTAYTIQPAIDAAYEGGGGEVWVAQGVRAR